MDNPAERIADARGVKPSFFDEVYTRQPSWEIGRPQAAVQLALKRGVFQSPVVDLGCGTGQNARLLARHGLQVFAVDFVARAIDVARTSEPISELVRFEQASVLKLAHLIPDQWAASLLDSGLFHVFSDSDRMTYCAELARIARPGAPLVVICFSEHESCPGPRRVTQAELIAALATEWHVQSAERVRYELNANVQGASAWMSVLIRRDQ